MGVTQVTVAVCNPGDPERRWEGLFLVDTGALTVLSRGTIFEKSELNHNEQTRYPKASSLL